MRYLSFKILILCILLPPIFYIATIQYLERLFNDRYSNEIEDTYIGDTRPLFTGSIWLPDAINENINRYIQSKMLLSWGAKLNVTVTTKRGTILYPPVFEEEADSLSPFTPMRVASENYAIMKEGLVVNADLILGHNTALSNTLLGLYVLLSLSVFYCFYRSALRKAKQEDLEKSKEIERLWAMKNVHTKRLKTLGQNRQDLTFELEALKTELEAQKSQAYRNEEDMIEELVSLEGKIQKNIALQAEQQEEINSLKEKIKGYEKQRDGKQKTRAVDSLQKRFNTLYKNIIVTDRAISGFNNLTDELKIKGEEIIHQLNEAPDLVPIKRKVFAKKGRNSVLEVIFAYKGRLYFRKAKDNRIEVLTVGTKNTQVKDLEFLDNI